MMGRNHAVYSLNGVSLPKPKPAGRCYKRYLMNCPAVSTWYVDRTRAWYSLTAPQQQSGERPGLQGNQWQISLKRTAFVSLASKGIFSPLKNWHHCEPFKMERPYAITRRSFVIPMVRPYQSWSTLLPLTHTT